MAKKQRSLETIRRAITQLQQELVPLREGRRTHAEAVAKLERWVDTRGSEINAAPTAMSAARGDTMLTDSSLRAERATIDYMAWLFPDELKKRLAGELDGVADHCSDLPADKRRELCQEKEQQLYQLEQEEEAAIVELEQAGEAIARRPDARAEIVLEVGPAEETEREPEAEVHE